MIRLIASDIDGTLLQHGAKELNPRMFELIMELKEQGIHFVAASGRQYNSLYDLFAPVRDEISYVAENGSLCIHNGQVLSKGMIDRELGLRIMDRIRKYNECSCILSCESTLYTDTKDQAFITLLTEEFRYKLEVVDDLRDITDDFLKIAVHSPLGTKAMEEYFNHYFGNEIKIVTSGADWLDFIAPNANKATGLKSLTEHFQISAKDCVAFGDQYNDVEMLQYVGTSYAMSGAAPGISYYSTYVTDSVEDVLEDILVTAKLKRI